MAAIEAEIVSSQTPIPQHSVNPALGNDLTLRSNRFIDHWIKSGNGTESARVAGFPGDDNSLAVSAHRLLRNHKVAAEIRRRLGKHIASSDEVLETLTKHSRSDIADVLESDGSFDLKAAKKRGVSALLRKLKVKTRYEKDSAGNVTPIVEHEFELHDAQAATVHLGKVYRLFGDKNESDVSLSDQDVSRIGEQLVTSLLEAASRRRLEAAKAEGTGRLTDGTV